MRTTRRKWSTEQKLAILKEAETNGVVQTIRKHDLGQNTFYLWKQKYDVNGESGLKQDYARIDPELKRLQLENLRLKQILADKELALQIKDELLKKSQQRSKTS